MVMPDYKRPKPAHAKFRTQHLPGRGWYVEDPEGRRVSCFHSDIDNAVNACVTAQEEFDAAQKRKRRACLCCGGEFVSEGIHNRMCNRCRLEPSNDIDVPFSFGTIHGRKRSA